jgi:hypothetical protein
VYRCSLFVLCFFLTAPRTVEEERGKIKLPNSERNLYVVREKE